MVQKQLLGALLMTVSGVALANSSVTLQGVTDLGVQYQSFQTGRSYEAEGHQRFTSFGVVSGAQNVSRWGLRGAEDLGDGVSVSFEYEQGLNASSGRSADGFARRSTLGIHGDEFGALEFGRRTSPVTAAFKGIDPFESSYGTAGLQNSLATTMNRYSNMVMYTTPDLEGLSARLGYSFDADLSLSRYDTKTDQFELVGAAPLAYETRNRTRVLSIGLRYHQGPLVIAAGWDRIQAPGSFSFASKKIDAWLVGASYDFGGAVLHGAYGQHTGGLTGPWQIPKGTGVDAYGVNHISQNVFVESMRTSSWMLGLTVPLDEGVKLMASVQQMFLGGSLKGRLSAPTGIQTIASVGLSYELSRSTGMYGYVSYGNNMTMLQGVKMATVSMGMRHTF
ncbi:porin [Orrella sp. 11846]|uniref:porin n=1 Tax=Orrella sp. 11846 TaxID=3409913 RepID=UPI003B5CEFF8